MKKIMLSLATVVAFFMFLSCGNESTNAQTNNDENAAQLAENVSTNNEINANTSNENTGTTIQITKADFLEKVMNYEENPEVWKFEGNKPCIVDFYADWCAPCRITSPILEELAAEYAGQINIYKVDTDQERELAAVFGIQSIPSFLFCPVEGKPMMTAGIAQTKEETKEMFRKQIDEFLLETSTN